MNTEKPYSEKDYEKAKQLGLDLDNWNDYVKFFELIGDNSSYNFLFEGENNKYDDKYKDYI